MDELICEVELLPVLRYIIESMPVLEYTNASEKEKSESDLQLVHNQGQLRLLLHSTPSHRQIAAEAADESYRDVKDFVTEDYEVTL